MSLNVRKSIDWSEHKAVIEILERAAVEEVELEESDFTSAQWAIAKLYIKTDWNPSKYAASKKSVANSCATIMKMFARIKYHEAEIPAGIMEAVKIVLDDVQNISTTSADYSPDNEDMFHLIQQEKFAKIALPKKN